MGIDGSTSINLSHPCHQPGFKENQETFYTSHGPSRVTTCFRKRALPADFGDPPPTIPKFPH